MDVSSSKPYERLRSHKIRKVRPLGMECQWNFCTRVFHEVEELMLHLAVHKKNISDSDSSDGYLCFWRDCGFMTQEKDDLIRHIFYHGFHTKIMSIGDKYMAAYNMKCTLDRQARNLIPDIPEDFRCMWSDCEESFYCAQTYYWHVHSHIQDVELKGDCHCKWLGCSYRCKFRYLLKKHALCHTQEKVIACPNCGGIFSKTSNLSDHIERQIPPEQHHYKCTLCPSKFSTKSFLRLHLKYHKKCKIHECSQCSYTCFNKTALQNHNKDKHGAAKIHQCPVCSKILTRHLGLVRHVITHSEGKPYICVHPKCRFSCKCAGLFRKHIRKTHKGVNPKSHACHKCDGKFYGPVMLIKHLVDKHNFILPGGDYQFKYMRDHEGCLRLYNVKEEHFDTNQEVNDEVASEDTDEIPSSPKIEVEEVEHSE